MTDPTSCSQTANDAVLRSIDLCLPCAGVTKEQLVRRMSILIAASKWLALEEAHRKDGPCRCCKGYNSGDGVWCICGFLLDEHPQLCTMAELRDAARQEYEEASQ